jgi:hypothetical protein
LYQTGFEPPTFAVGPINGQDSWTANSNILVQNTLNNGGSQAVSITPIGLASLLAMRPIAYSATTMGNLVRVKVDMFLTSTGTPSNWDAIVAMGSGGLMAHMLVAGSTARLGVAGGVVGAVAITRGAWNTYQLDLDMTAQTATGFVNGTQVGTGTFTVSPGNVFNQVEFGLNSLPGSDTGTFDNVVITTPNAPPSTPPGATVPTLSEVGLACLASLLMISAYVLMRRQSAA